MFFPIMIIISRIFMKIKSIFFTLLLTCVSFGVQASQIRQVTETFSSGATFDGQVTFTSDFSNVTAVDGWLVGGTYGADHINWIWNPSANFGGGASLGGNFLMSGVQPAWTNFVTFTWNYSDTNNLTFASGSYGNNVNYGDSAVSGTISNIPEPGSLLLLVVGIFGLAAIQRKQKA